MKISKIHIHKFNQFNNFELDLTYPKGHPKEGLPLDKVCFIGQSGTGKTTILNLINTYALKTKDKDTQFHPGKLKVKESESISFELDLVSPNNDSVWHSISSKSFQGNTRSDSIFKKIIFLPAGLFSRFLFDEKMNTVQEEEFEYETNSFRFFYFEKKSIEKLWRYSFLNVQKYQSSEATFRLKQTHKLEEGEEFSFAEIMQNWRKKNPNPLEKIASDCLDPILNKFFLSVKTKIENYENRKFIQVQSTQSEEIIPFENLSSGTRQIIFTAFPIYSLLENDSVVLIDEPENSLYPDIQKEIIEYYTSFDKEKKSQFFFATHSPIIASSFEPWEIVELKFDNEGNIYRELYFDKEKGNHVDHYHTDARYLRWDQIYTRVFDMKIEAREEFRGKKLKEFSILKKKIKNLKNDPNFDSKSKEFQKLREEFLRIGELIDSEN